MLIELCQSVFSLAVSDCQTLTKSCSIEVQKVKWSMKQGSSIQYMFGWQNGTSNALMVDVVSSNPTGDNYIFAETF